MEKGETSNLRSSVNKRLETFEQLAVIATKTGKSEDLASLVMVLKVVIDTLQQVHDNLGNSLSPFITKN